MTKSRGYLLRFTTSRVLPAWLERLRLIGQRGEAGIRPAEPMTLDERDRADEAWTQSGREAADEAWKRARADADDEAWKQAMMEYDDPENEGCRPATRREDG